MMRIQSPPTMATTGMARKNSEILAITGKITQALQDFDLMYDGNADDEMLNDLTSQIDCLESGPLKYQLNEFVMKYKDVSTRSDERRTERNEVLESVMQWFSTSTFSDDFAEATSEAFVNEKALEESNAVLKDELLNTKVAFDKLQKLNSEMVNMSEKGLDISHLERESKSMRQHAIMNFKAYKTVSMEVKQQREMIQVGQIQELKDNNVNQVWKHAAGEICGMLSKVRDEGGEYVVDLEKRIRTLTNDVQDRAHLFERMERQLKEFEALEQKWKNDNMKLIDEKATIKKKLTTYRKELKKTYKLLSKHERVKVPKFLEADDTEESKEDAPLIFAKAEEAAAKKKAAKGPAIPAGGLNDPAILRAQLKNCKNEVEKLQQDKEELEQEIEKIREAFEDMEDDCLRLERDKAELLHQMKQNSVRPDVRKLSSTAPPIPHRSSRTLSGSLTIVQIKTTDSTEKLKGKKCCKCGGVRSESVMSPVTSVTSKIAATGEEVKVTPSEIHRKSPTPEGPPPPTKSHIMNIEIKRKEEEVQSLSDRCVMLSERVKELELELELSQQKNVTAQQIIDNMETELCQAKEKQMEANIKLEDFIKKLQQSHIVSPAAPQRTADDIEEPAEDDMSTDVIRARHKLLTDAHIISHKSVQTDPKLDPLGPWSKNNYGSNAGWQPVKPPDKWVEFDPVNPELDIEQAKPQEEHDPLRNAMMAGAEPEDVQEQTDQCTNMIQRELQRMSQGIQGFVEYTNNLVDRETRIMANANMELKSKLTPQEVVDIDQVVHETGSGIKLGKGGSKEALVNRILKGGGARALGISPSSADAGIMTMDEHIKREIKKVGQRSVDALKKLFRLASGTLKEKNQEYERIYCTIQKKQPGKVRRVRISDEVQDLEDLAPGAKRSKSHSDILKLEDDDEIIAAVNSSGQPGVIKSKSQAWLTSPKSRVTILNLGDVEHKSSVQVNEVEKEKPIGKATITKKGQIILTTTPIQQTEFGTTFNKVQDPVFRKIKPSPINHSKLKKKHIELMSRKDNKGGHIMYGKSSKGVRNPVGKGVLTEFELPADFYSEYTVGELEQTATKIVDQHKQQHYDGILEKAHLPFVKQLMSPRQNSPGRIPLEDRFLPML